MATRTPAWRRWVVAGPVALFGILAVALAGDGIDTGWAAGLFLLGAWVLVFGGATAAIAVGERATRFAVVIAAALMAVAAVALLAETDFVVLAIVGLVCLVAAIVLFASGLAADRREDRAELAAARPGSSTDAQRTIAGLPARGRAVAAGWWRPMAGRTIVGGLIMAWVLAGTIVTLVEWRSDRVREDRSTLAVMGTVVRHSDDGDHIVVRYRVPRAGGDGRTLVTRTSVFEASDHPVGSDVPVHVDPGDPGSIWVERYDPGTAFVFAVMGTALALSLVVRPFRSLRGQARLLRDQEAPGRIVQIQSFEASPARVGLWPEGPSPDGWSAVRVRRRSRRFAFLGERAELVGPPRPGAPVAVLGPRGPVWLRGRLETGARLNGLRPVSPAAAHGPGVVPSPLPAPAASSPAVPCGWAPPPVARPAPPSRAPGPPSPVPGAAGEPPPRESAVPATAIAPSSPSPKTPDPGAVPATVGPRQPPDGGDEDEPERWTPPPRWRPAERWSPERRDPDRRSGHDGDAAPDP